MSNIANAFKNGKAFIPFITCGDPDLETTGKVIRAAVENGADLIELGIPFSDPTAEGPVIQEANIRALNAGVTTDKIFDFIRELRKDVSTPIVFMTYANVVFSYGSEKFISACAEIGIDGMIIPDLPFEEKDEFDPICRKYGVDLISIIAPTSKQRVSIIAKEAAGFLYIIPGLGVTGVHNEVTTDFEAVVKSVRENTDIPCAIAFGVSPNTNEMTKLADGVIVGCDIVNLVERYGKKAAVYVGEYVRAMKAAM
ncbi:MAG: tryptophan synthase subunit alpha [Oscillospiraceae bacterium]|nr:tryptophan synthase subunit alpha [Oscillospiraceae bacterium]